MTQLLHELPSIKLLYFQGCFASIFHTVGGKERSHGLFCIFRDDQVNPEFRECADSLKVSAVLLSSAEYCLASEAVPSLYLILTASNTRLSHRHFFPGFSSKFLGATMLWWKDAEMTGLVDACLNHRLLNLVLVLWFCVCVRVCLRLCARKRSLWQPAAS